MAIYHNLFIPSSIDGHLGYFHFGATINNATMNIHGHLTKFNLHL